jgi:hypothetical protein
MKYLQIPIPLNCEEYSGDIWRFTQRMLTKLSENVHKGHWRDVDIPTALDLLKEEVVELEQEIYDEHVDGTHRECADVANFALIISSVLDRRTPSWSPNSKQRDLFDPDSVHFREVDQIRNRLKFSNNICFVALEEVASDELILELRDVFKNVL